MLRGKISQVKVITDRIIDGWEVLDGAGGWDPEPLKMSWPWLGGGT